MKTREKTDDKKKSRADYHREYRAKASAEKKKQWSEERQRRKQRAKQEEEEAIQAKVRAKSAASSRRSRAKRRAIETVVLPQTPNSKAKVINDLIDSASPNTSAKLADNYILSKSTGRKAQADIVQATSVIVKNSKVRKTLLPQLQTSNKKVVSKQLGISRNHFYYQSQKGLNPKTPPSLIQSVVEFYSREDITVCYPNKNKSGNPIKVLKYSRKRTFSLFKEEYPGVKIQQTTFNKLKPSSVKLMKHAKWLQCLCDICDNIGMLRKALKAAMRRDSFETPEYLDSDVDLAKATVCNIRNIECIDRKCGLCSTRGLQKDFSTWMSDDTHIPMHYTKWCRVDEQVGDRKVTKLKKVQCSGQRWQIVHELQLQLQKFPCHLYTAMSQLSSYKKCKKTIGDDEVIAVVDFAENYVCRQFAEAQTAYYARNSVTIHPMVLIFPDSADVKRDSVVAISDDRKHDGSAVKSFISILESHISVHYPHIQHIIFWSDGCGVQYKSRLPFFNIANAFDSRRSITWNFFGSRHGKGESDGESAVVKSYLDSCVRSQQLTIHNAYDVFQLLVKSPRYITDSSSRRHFYFCAQSDIDFVRSNTPSSLCPVPNIRTIHQVLGGSRELRIKRLSCYCNAECSHHPDYTTFRYPVPSDMERMSDFFEQEVLSDSEHIQESDSDGEEIEHEQVTSSVDEFIRSHPDIFSADADEEDDFCDWEEFNSPMEAELGLGAE